MISDNDLIYKDWLRQFGLRDKKFYCSVGRFVPENNFEIMIREFMNSKTDKDFVIITTKNDKFLMKLDKKLCFSKDKRIKFVGAIYNQALLKKIRENAYGYFHGHEVGGTNPSLLEALGATKINLLLDVSFNREVAGNAALYWTKQKGDLKQLIESADLLNEKEIENLRKKAQRRILNHYTWDHISTQYLQQFTEAYKRSQTERK